MTTRTQMEINADVEAMIPTPLYEKYTHLSYADMAEVPELAEWADELREAEAEWFAAEE